MNTTKRLLYIDNLRLALIVFVVMQHLATNSGLGSCVYYANLHLNTLSSIWFSFYPSFQQAYFMGLLFLIAGYFTVGSFNRKGCILFIRDRFKRLIIPTLFYIILLNPFVQFLSFGNINYNIYDFISGTGVMWFTVALFIFSLFYALCRFFSQEPDLLSNNIELSFKKVLILILLISVSVFILRIFFPIGSIIFNMQLSYFASYIVLFIMGIVAYKTNLFSKIDYKTGKKWLISGVFVGFVAWFVLITIVGKSNTVVAINGGLTWQSAAYSTWESFVAVAMSIGLVALFKEKLNYQTRLLKTLSDNSFTVYMIQLAIITPIILLFEPVALHPIVKWLLMCLICMPVCFIISNYFVRKIPLLKSFL